MGGRPTPISPPNSGPHGTGQNTPTTTTNTTTSSRDRANPGGQQPFSEVAQPLPPAAQPYPPAEAPDAADLGPAVPFVWQRGVEIGNGAFGTVYKGLVHATGQEIAVKQVSLPRDAANRGKASEHIRALESEVDVLRGLLHDNIVRYLGTERTTEHLNIFLEYVAGGSLNRKVAHWGPLHEDTIRVYTKQILRGLEYLHQQRIMHRDIKGANILVDVNGVVKLADFGASKKIEDLATVGGGSRSVRGTPNWMAPEVIKQSGHGRAADIWSLGCVIIEMATGRPPWSNFTDGYTVMYHIASTRDLPAMPDTLSPQAKDFLALCFNRVPRERPNATRLIGHPWLHGVVVPRPSGPPARLLPAPLPLPPMQQQHQQQRSQHPQHLPPTAPALPPLAPAPPPPLLQQPLPQPPGLRSPPSPIKEESDSRYGSPATATGGSSAPTPTTARSAMLNAAAAAAAAGVGAISSFPSVASPPPPARPMVPPLPLEAMKLGLLTGQQAGPNSGPLQNVAGVAQPSAAMAARPPLPPPQAPAPSRTSAPPAQQYDTIVDQEAVRLHLQRLQQQAAASAAAAAAAGIAASMVPSGGDGAPVAPAMGLGGGGMVGGGSMMGMGMSGMGVGMSLSGFNPVEEPSWMPQQNVAHQAFFQQLAAVAEHSAPASPDVSSGGVGPAAAAGGGPDASSTHHQYDTCKPPSARAGPVAGDLALTAAVAAAAGVSPRSGAGTQRGTARSRGVVVPQRPALTDIFAAANEDADTGAEPDQPSPASAAGSAAGPWSPGSTKLQQRVAPATAASRPRVSASRRALEEAGILGGTLDPALAKQWRDELVAELEAERLRAGGGGKQQRESVAVAAGGGGGTARPSVADL
ncbi:Mitogen-activated protein kinase kinase kinase ANP1 [Tetrabaena socialis]|uniref:mitogen-activated protein kinase kinase kinase n=1 Tax=Tetrabaena socialis TaxID=47790 RepID=A0A2J8AF60_9CHLO|nr:Mitogen-activated protein kinase kinase kinase ANP1 [Tetrabaena socialis]|eukprot:PNH11142.1 Mitogen-activated protein kinase kinase kinase ANP1 [Tetrabaena socialis]